ncbi:MAG: FKBP-type peptidyl-prolyl cis-trans isomerase [Nocardioides sp.]
MIRRALFLFLTLLLGAALVACGDDSSGTSEEEEEASSAGGSGLSSVEIAGEPGADPEVTWDGELEADEIETEVITEGEGDDIETGDSVLAHIWIGNGFTQEKAYSTYDATEPQLFTVDEAQLSPLFLSGLEGQKVGSRVAIAASAETAFGEAGNPELNIGNKDTVLTIIDVLSAVEDSPEGEDQKAPSWVPSLQGEEDAPTGFDFAGAPEPTEDLRSAVLVQGDGPVVEKAQTIAVNYLGQVYDGKQPFDESYSAQPTAFPIGIGSVVEGWDQALVGETVGSRVVLAIPPDLGYGEKGNPQAGIKGTDTLYFVVDILGAA